MGNAVTQIFSDNEGHTSSMRIMAFLALLIAGALAILPTLGYGKCEVDSMSILWFLTASFGGKVFQKHLEKGS